VSPLEVSPHAVNTVYYGSQYVHRTRDGGITWEQISPDLTWNPPERQQSASGEPITIDVTGEEYYSTLYAIRESVLEPGVIWTGSNDGPFHITRDNGRTWTKITPPDQPPGCRVQNIDPSPHRRASAYYAVHCYLLGDFKPYLWRTDDYGKSWTLLTTGSNGIPGDHPTRVVREDPEREGLLFAGTEFGMFFSFDNGGRWQSLQMNLPATPVTDLRVHEDDVVLSTQGRSFWILSNIGPLRQAGDRVFDTAAHLFKPGRRVPHLVLRIVWWRGSGGDPADPSIQARRADRLLVSAGTTGLVKLDILDRRGRGDPRFPLEGAGNVGDQAQHAAW
jgi:photosystem II stability/assembly factor-like uncharacterized protein